MRTPLIMLMLLRVAFVLSGVPDPAAAQSPPRTDTLSLHSETFHNTRLLRIWVPPGYDDPANKSERYPVVYFTDGVATQHGRRLDSTAASLTARGAIPPAIFVMIDNGGSTTTSRAPGRDRAAVGTDEGGTTEAREAMVSDARTLAHLIATHSPRTRACFWSVPGAQHGEDAWRARLPAALTFLLGSGVCPGTPLPS